MASERNKRLTQLDFKSLRGLWEPTQDGASAARENTPAKKPSTNRLSSPTAEKPAKLVKPLGLKARTHATIPVEEGCSPWKHYEKMYALRLGLDHRAIVAEERHPPAGSVANVYSIRKLLDPDMKTKQDMIQSIRHQNFVSVYKLYALENVCYVVLEHMPCSLHEICANEHLNELRLAAIVGQILDGLIYLEQNGLEHGSLSCSNILLAYSGVLKIGEQEHCYNQQADQPYAKDVRDLGPIVMELITGDYKDDIAVFNRWTSSHAMDFAIRSASARRTADLSQHPLLQLPWKQVSLIGLVNFGVAKARRGCRAAGD